MDSQDSWLVCSYANIRKKLKKVILVFIIRIYYVCFMPEIEELDCAMSPDMKAYLDWQNEFIEAYLRESLSTLIAIENDKSTGQS